MLRQAAHLQPVSWRETLHRLEWIGAPKAGVDSPAPSDFGPIAASRLETVAWEGWQLRVPPLDMQRAVSQRRGLTTRVALIDAILNQ
jgi:hypothetical protein